MTGEMKMNNFDRGTNIFGWLMALLLAFLVTGCSGGGGSSGDTGVTIISSTPAPGAPGTVPPGTVPSGSSVPYVLSSIPANGATNVAVNTVASDNTLHPRSISATFSEAMNPLTLVSPATSITVKETVSGTGVAGVVSLDASKTVVTFTPTAPLTFNTQFTAIITTAATNTAGTPLSIGYGWSFTTAQAPISLQTAANFLVLGGTSIDNISTGFNPTTQVNGQLGIDPGHSASVTGFTDSTPVGTGIILTGGIQSGSVVTQAKADLLAALTEAKARSSSYQVAVGSNELAAFTVNGGSPGVYPPGLYSSASTLTLNSGNMTLDARGDPDAIWVFQAASDLIVGDTRQMVLLNGAKARNVFWTLGSAASIGDQVSFKGNLLAGSSSTIGTGAGSGTTVEGRILSVTGLYLNYTTVNAPAP